MILLEKHRDFKSQLLVNIGIMFCLVMFLSSTSFTSYFLDFEGELTEQVEKEKEEEKKEEKEKELYAHISVINAMNQVSKTLMLHDGKKAIQLNFAEVLVPPPEFS